MSKILIVDDEPSIVDMISVALENEGFLPKSCNTAGDALDELESLGFDLIILDIGLPDMNGFELARRIRSTSKIPIIFLTARSSEIDRVVGYLPPEGFLEELKRIQRGENTIADYIAKTKENPNDFDLWKTLAEKYEERRDLQSASE